MLNPADRKTRMVKGRFARLNAAGFSLLEVLITLTILGIIAAGVVPITRNSLRHQKEVELHQALRDLRDAIDRYKRFNDSNPGAIPIEERTQSGYPKTLQLLVDGFTPAGLVGDAKIKFLRRMPIDPMTGNSDWGTRAYSDDPGSDGGGSDDEWDVFSKSEGVALNNTKYKDW